jgi:hypothetical protein
MIAALDGQVITLGRGRGYLNVLDITLALDAVRRLGDGEHAKLGREVLADAVGRRHTMVSALISIQRGHPPNDREDSMPAAALRVLDERHAGTPVLIWREICQVGDEDFSHLRLVSRGVVVGWVGGGPAGCARRAVRLIYADLGMPQDHGSSWGAAV